MLRPYVSNADLVFAWFSRLKHVEPLLKRFLRSIQVLRYGHVSSCHCTRRLSFVRTLRAESALSKIDVARHARTADKLPILPCKSPVEEPAVPVPNFYDQHLLILGVALQPQFIFVLLGPYRVSAPALNRQGSLVMHVIVLSTPRPDIGIEVLL